MLSHVQDTKGIFHAVCSVILLKVVGDTHPCWPRGGNETGGASKRCLTGCGAVASIRFAGRPCIVGSNVLFLEGRIGTSSSS